jgi:aspartyl-tRNA(Asn)/glutamyl-tRNA(Gln) amidotransferase subunit A
MTVAPGDLTIAAAARRLAARQITSEALTSACLDRIAARRDLNAFISVFEERAIAEARAADRALVQGRSRGALHGIPISLKDLIDVEGTCTTAASRVRAGHVAAADATVTTRLREAGAVIVGKCNLHEFAFGTTSEDTAFGPVRNPADTTRSAGGSSGGSAVSLVARMALASIGTDTGGSIRIPAAACGCVGLKPTWGEVPLDGVVPLSRSLDHVGPLVRSVADAWIVLAALKGQGLDLAHADLGKASVRGIRIGVPRRYFFDLLDDEVRARTEAALERLRAAGATIVEVDIPSADDIQSIYLHIVLPEAAEYHARTLDTCPELYTPAIRLRLELGRYVLAEDYVRAQRGREVLRRDVTAALEACYVLALPSLPIPAPPLGLATASIGGRTESVRNLMLRMTQLFNLTGHPAISIPSGTTANGLPCGLQLVGRHGRTEDLLRAALAAEPSVMAADAGGSEGGGGG